LDGFALVVLLALMGARVLDLLAALTSATLLLLTSCQSAGQTASADADHHPRWLCSGKNVQFIDIPARRCEPDGAILRVDENDFKGSFDCFGFPRGFNLGGTLNNDDSFRHLPSLIYDIDGNVFFRDAGTDSSLVECSKA